MTMKITILPVGMCILAIAGCATDSSSTLRAAKEQTAEVPKETLDTRVAVLLAQGDIAARDGRIDQAFHFFLLAERLDPADDRALVRAGNLHRTLGNRDTAEKAWRLALTRNPQNGVVHESLGFLLLEAGRYSDAYESFELALRFSGGSSRAAIGMGLASEKRNEFTRALGIYDTALVNAPNSVELKTYRARALMSLGRFAEAKVVITQIIDEPMPVTWIVRGDLFAIDGEYAGALGAYLETLSEPWAYQRLGEHAMRRRDYAKAMDYFRRAAAASPIFFADAERGLQVAREHLDRGEQSR
jgi:tetratricopeptide (TPR) repeat protein